VRAMGVDQHDLIRPLDTVYAVADLLGLIVGDDIGCHLAHMPHRVCPSAHLLQARKRKLPLPANERAALPLCLASRLGRALAARPRGVKLPQLPASASVARQRAGGVVPLPCLTAWACACRATTRGEAASASSFPLLL